MEATNMNRLMVAGLMVVLMMALTVPVWAGDDDKGRVTLPTATVTVPNVCNLSLVKAISTLRAAGFIPQTQLSDRDGEARIVIRQDPAAGTKVAAGSNVSIFGQLASITADEKGKVSLPR